MKNAKDELLNVLQDRQLKCALIKRGDSWIDEDEETVIVLKIGYDKEDYQSFLNELNFDYDNGYGSQELHGAIWFTDNGWATRAEYDGSEWWKDCSLPEIPDLCIKSNNKEK